VKTKSFLSTPGAFTRRVSTHLVSALLATTLIASMFLLTACSAGTGIGSKTPVLDEKFLEQAHTAVKEAYGEDYLPNMPFESATLKEVYGLPMEDAEAFFAEGPMISAHVDTYIGIRAKAGKGPSMAEALEAYREKLIADSFQYPMNMAKVQASMVYTIGDHVFFLMLGRYNDADEQTEEQALSYAKTQTQIGVDAIGKLIE